MTTEAWIARDNFSFSLGAARSLNGYAFVPVTDGRLINAALRRRVVEAAGDTPGLVHKLEDFLARYFAPGCHA